MNNSNNNRVVEVANIIVMLVSIMIIVILSFESLSTTIVFSTKFILNFQLSVSIIFILDLIIRLYYNHKKLSYFLLNIPLLLISIPYLNIIDWANISISDQLHVILRVIPFIRGIYGSVIAIRWITRNKISTLFFSYIISIIGITYCSSIMFFTLEHGINSQVKTYWDVVWWACMTVTTVGSNIYGVTTVGQILEIVLACSGMLMFPIFTTYIAAKYNKQMDSTSDIG